jgi:hypothetical protein
VAEFLIYNKNHWSEDVPQKEKDKWTEKEKAKFAMCQRKGDVVEIRPDGFWDARGFNKDAFAVVKVPGLSLEDAKQYSGRLVDGENNVIKKFKYTIPVETMDIGIEQKITFNKLVDVGITEKTE